MNVEEFRMVLVVHASIYTIYNCLCVFVVVFVHEVVLFSPFIFFHERSNLHLFYSKLSFNLICFLSSFNILLELQLYKKLKSQNHSNNYEILMAISQNASKLSFNETRENLWITYLYLFWGRINKTESKILLTLTYYLLHVLHK